jgi:hypothetical protein
VFERHIQAYSGTPEVSQAGSECTFSSGLILRPQLSLSCVFLLYAVSIIYMDMLRLSRDEASKRHARTVLRILERCSHPAATLTEAVCQDLLSNFVTVSGCSSHPDCLRADYYQLLPLHIFAAETREPIHFSLSSGVKYGLADFETFAKDETVVHCVLRRT